MLGDYVKLSFNNIRKRGVRSWLTMLGIFIGIAAVISLISLGNGLRTAITGQFSELGADKLTVMATETGFGPPGASAVRKLNEHDLSLAKRINGVESAVARLIRVGSVDYNKIRTYEYIASIPPGDRDIELIYETLALKTESGRLLTKSDRKKVVLGHDFLGDRFSKKIKVGNILTIQGEEFQVVGFLQKASSFQINSVILMPEDDMKQILNIGDEIDLIAIQVSTPDHVEQTARELTRAMRQDRHEKEGEEDFAVQTPEQSLQTVNTTLAIINAVVVAIAAISLLVGGIGITNTMYTAVLERRKEIGVMKAVGAQNRDILAIFLAESSFLGLAGGIVGVIIGLGIAYAAAAAVNGFAPGLSFGVTISPVLIFGMLAFSLAVGAISGVVPALQASRMRPMEALRG